MLGLSTGKSVRMEWLDGRVTDMKLEKGHVI